MPVKKDPSGRRSVQAEVEVPGTPEEVWKAIATGPGVSSWFVPARSDERVGGTVNLNFGPGMDSVSTITAWDPPHRMAAESKDDMGPGGPAIATEWIVEAKAGGTCIVRVVHSWFASTDDWDNQFEGMEHGWPSFFRILRLYLTYFRDQPSAAFQLLGMSSESQTNVWNQLAGPLKLANVVEGERLQTPAGAPRLAGVVENVGPAEYPGVLVRLDQPAPGVAHVFTVPMGGMVCYAVRFYFYGNSAADTIEREEPVWQEWIGRHFPAVGTAGSLA
jgi:uncharacterized protein YndB with AHSA1/START domain